MDTPPAFIYKEPAPKKSRGEELEALAFTFCKVATVAMLAQRFVIPVASGLTALLYVLAYLNGKKDTRCILRAPLFIAAFWGAVCITSLVIMFHHRAGS